LRGNGPGQPHWEQKLRRLLAEGKAGKVKIIPGKTGGEDENSGGNP